MLRSLKLLTRSRTLGISWGVVLVCAAAAACGSEEEPEASAQTAGSAKAGKATPGPAGDPSLPSELQPAQPAADAGAATAEEAADAAPDAPYEGPWFAVTKIAAGVYAEPRFDKKKKLGYIRNGGRTPTNAKIVSKQNCSGGWYEVAGGGYVCGNLGTTDLEHPEVKHAIKQPNWDEVLPYTYARNAKNGTPLYRSVPSRDQMDQYEPYLASAKKKAAAEAKKKAEAEAEKKKAAAKAEAKKKATAKQAKSDDSEKKSPEPDATGGSKLLADKKKDTSEKGSKPKPKSSKTAKSDKADDDNKSKTRPASDAKPAAADDDDDLKAAFADAGVVAEAEDAGVPDVPWWQQENIKERLHEVTLEQLAADSDDILAKRMVSGFYVAVDKTFRWNGRLWYKTTKGLVAPADRFWQTAGSKFKGVELGKEVDGKTLKLPIGWVYGGRKSAPTYEIDLDTKKTKPKNRVKRFEAIQLTGREVKIHKTTFHEMADGEWIKTAHIRITKPAAPPEDVGSDERWIDVNTSEQTLVAFRGTQAVYATLVSTGKSSRVKKKDHSTPVGEFRIREKHITTTMDGNGSAAGDLPYSIEDVPYVMYYKGSYALHGAFWHRNYGVKMSHGCTNLAPLDAKWVFRFTGPHLPTGWHGGWSSDGNLGSRIRVHE